jgi:hypothetical protein
VFLDEKIEGEDNYDKGRGFHKNQSANGGLKRTWLVLVMPFWDGKNTEWTKTTEKSTVK